MLQNCENNALLKEGSLLARKKLQSKLKSFLVLNFDENQKAQAKLIKTLNLVLFNKVLNILQNYEKL